jgi:hypothetical protein
MNGNKVRRITSCVECSLNSGCTTMNAVTTQSDGLGTNNALRSEDTSNVKHQKRQTEASFSESTYLSEDWCNGWPRETRVGRLEMAIGSFAGDVVCGVGLAWLPRLPLRRAREICAREMWY